MIPWYRSLFNRYQNRNANKIVKKILAGSTQPLDVTVTETTAVVLNYSEERFQLQEPLCNNFSFLVFYAECGDRYFDGATGRISSPNFPKAYANNLDCYNYIRVMPGRTIILEFLAFKTQSPHDWVTVRISKTIPLYWILSGVQRQV